MDGGWSRMMSAEEGGALHARNRKRDLIMFLRGLWEGALLARDFESIGEFALSSVFQHPS